MADTESTTPITASIDAADKAKGNIPHGEATPLHLRRWLVSFASGGEWYPVGEYVALDAAAAIDRAIEVFGAGAGYRAEEIPWDAAPLVRPKTLARREPR